MRIFRAATHAFQEIGAMDWGFLKADDLNIAGQMCVRLNNISYMWKIGYLDTFINYGPGSLLLYRYIDKLMSEGAVKEINFMNSREWLKHWKTKKRELYSLIIMPRIPGISDLIKSLLFLKALKTKHINPLIRKFNNKQTQKKRDPQPKGPFSITTNLKPIEQ
jgi:hypothetical protein